MNISALFIRRPIGTTLLTVALALAGLIAYQFLPVAPLPQVEFPTIDVQAALPRASPEIMASAVATPLERQFGRIAGLNEMTSTSFLGSTRITLQFDLSRNINAAARDVQAAINAARGQLPANLPNNPFYRKSNPADSPVVILALTSDIMGRARLYDIGSSIVQQKLSQVPGVGRVLVWGGRPASRIENIMRHLEQGTPPFTAALRGAREIGFTVVSITLSLLAVFIPILLMGGIFGRLFREFAVTLAVAVGVSLVVSLTMTPMMCAYLLRAHRAEGHGWWYNASERVFQGMLRLYEVTLAWVLRHQFLMLLVTLATIYVTVRLYIYIPKGFFPQQDTGALSGMIQADQSSSFQAMRDLLQQFVALVGEDPAVENVVGSTGGTTGSAVNTGRMFIQLKPLEERQISADQVMARLRGKLARVPGARLFMQANQELRIGGRQSGAQYQFTLQGDNVRELNEWAPRVLNKLRTLPLLTDVNSDQQDRGLEASLVIDRATATRLGVSTAAIDDTLYDAFGQRQVSTMYKQLNQYHVVLEVNANFWQNPDGLKHIYVRSANRTLVPLSAFTHYAPSNTPLAVNHQGLFPAVTISFNLAPGAALGDAVTAVERATREIGLPAAIRGSFQGTAQAFQDSLASQPLLIAAALVAVYIVLGVLYESYIHPLTILSTLPSAGVGALLALLLCGTDLSIIAIIGIILLIGIVKKNAIMMIDFALEAERSEGKSPEAAIFQACLLRFRPILMTTMAALLGGLPLALGMGTGAELRRPLGITIVGGLIFSRDVVINRHDLRSMRKPR